jgi:hypothetical protein
LKAAALKVAEPKGSVGSNPTPAASNRARPNAAHGHGGGGQRLGPPLRLVVEGIGVRLAKRRHGCRVRLITRRRILYWLGGMVAVLVVGTIIGLIWADTSDVAGFIAVVTNIVGIAGIVVSLIALAVVTRRQRHAA